MKALKRKFLLINIILMLMISSCQKEIITPENQALSSETEPQEIYYDNNVTAAVYGLLEISQNTTFRTIVNEEVGKEFDGDYNALLTTIAAEADMVNINLRNAFINSISLHSPDSATHLLVDSTSIYGFFYYDERSYVQIYIPFYDSINLNQDPIICLNLNDDDTLPGFKLVGNSLITYNVTEDMAKQNLVWVVSVNERTFGEPTVLPDSMIGGGTGMNKTNHGLLMKFTQININDKKEKWGNGKAEVYYVCARWTSTPCNEHLNIYGYNVAKIGKKDVNTWVDIKRYTILAAQDLYGTWLPGENMSILIYENDRRKKFEKTWVYPGTSCQIKYVSKESDFGDKNLSSAIYTHLATSSWQTREESFNDCTAKFQFREAL